MDFRLKAIADAIRAYPGNGFNPCSNGLSAQRPGTQRIESLASQRFNPCSNGLSAQSGGDGERWAGGNCVSILVLMDFRLKGSAHPGNGTAHYSFNPCSNGLSAQRSCGTRVGWVRANVSILVLMDFRLKASRCTLKS